MEQNDAAHVAQVLGGDRDAFRVLVDRHARRLFRLAYRMTGNQQDAEEAVQDAFLRAYRRLASFESRANFATWIYRICVNCALDLMRKRRGETAHRQHTQLDAAGEESDPMLDAPSPDPAPDRLAMSGELGAGVRAAMAALSASERAAFVMRHVDGCSIEEIAAALDLNAGATKNTIFRAVQKLRRQLEPFVGATR